jgi:putative DNA primase/helicase
VPEKGDVSDWIGAGHTFKDLQDRVTAAPAWNPTPKPEPEKTVQPEKPTEHSDKLPYGYSFSGRGLMWKDPEEVDKQAMHVAGCFDVEAMTRDSDGNSWGLLLRWKDPDGRDHRFALARSLLAGDGSEARRILTDQGLTLRPAKMPERSSMLSCFR